MSDNKLREPEARIIALRIAASFPGHEATTSQIKEKVPDYWNLSSADKVVSPTRPHEQVWQQIVGNVISHKDTATSIFVKGWAERTEDGIRVTQLGLEYLASKGY